MSTPAKSEKDRVVIFDTTLRDGEQCRYAYDKIKRLLAAHGASLADAVKQVVYVTDVRYQADVAKCRREAYGEGPIPANTFLVISALAIPGMLLEIDVTAVVGNK